MKKILFALALALSTSAVIAEMEGMDGYKYRVDQDYVAYIDANMMWGNSCEYKLNDAVSRESGGDGIIQSRDWGETLGVLCDHSMGFTAGAMKSMGM